MDNLAPGGVVLLEEEAAPGAPPVAATAPDGVVVLGEDGERELPARAVRNTDGSVELPLLHPVTLRFQTRNSSAPPREEHFDRLHLRRLNGADMRAIMAASDAAMVVVLLARSARIPEMKFGPVFDRMDLADINDASAVASGFLGTGRKTGR